ncbi:MAG: 50S ribosome-binding GTPase [Microthrixaceae bacterium]|nr:50S ribosome-binding GTPase [Microthrixaceae bacterium]
MPEEPNEALHATARTQDGGSVPVVAIVGRPNVGKSTLVNRILGRRQAIVEERPGVTRDRLEVAADWRGRDFTLVDTGGWLAGGSALDRKVSAQSEAALSNADVVLLVVDATVGVTDEDSRVADLLRSLDATVFVVANKVDDAVHEAGVWELLSLGLEILMRSPRCTAVGRATCSTPWWRPSRRRTQPQMPAQPRVPGPRISRATSTPLMSRWCRWPS